jgi:predicted PurR-regulated permease PerM
MSHYGRLHPATKAVLLGFGLLGFGLLFRELVTLLVAVLITVLIAIPLSAAASHLEGYGVPRVLGALVGLLIGVAAVAGVLALVIPPFVDQAELFVDAVPGIVDTLERELSGLGITGEGDAGQQIGDFLGTYTEDPGALVGPLASVGLGVAGVIGGFLLIVATAYYIAVSPQPLLNGLVSLVPPDRREWAWRAIERLRGAWIGWMQGVAVDMLVTGLLLYIGLRLLGLEFALVFAVFSALLVVIPYFGAILGGIPPVVYALTISPGKALLALGIYVLVQQIQSNITIPLIMAQRVKLHPAVVAIGVIVVGQLFGFIGLFVAVPILSLIVIGVDELWVRPLEQSRGVRPVAVGEAAAADQLELPEGVERAPPG